MCPAISSQKSGAWRSLHEYGLLILVSLSPVISFMAADESDNNKLKEIRSASAMTTVRTLRINDNEISTIDMSNFPKLRILYADGNGLARLSRNEYETSRLENLSLRNQRCFQLRLSKSELAPVKRLYVSGTSFSQNRGSELTIR